MPVYKLKAYRIVEGHQIPCPEALGDRAGLRMTDMNTARAMLFVVRDSLKQQQRKPAKKKRGKKEVDAPNLDGVIVEIEQVGKGRTSSPGDTEDTEDERNG